MDETLLAYLRKHRIDYVAHEHPAVFTVAESKLLKKEIPGLHCKCLFLKDDAEKFYLVAMPADKRLDMKLLRNKLDAKKLHFASETELKQELHLTPGSVSIFGAIHIQNKNVMLLVDQEVWDAPIVGFHPNINTSTLEITHENLERFYDSLNCKKEIMRLGDGK